MQISHQLISKIKSLEEKVRLLSDLLNLTGLSAIKISAMTRVPSDTLLTGDLFEIARLGSPNNQTYNTTIDDITTYVESVADSKYLQIANNLSDVNNRDFSVENLGLLRGQGLDLLVVSSDITLTNPLPKYIGTFPTAPGFNIILPPIDQPNSQAIGEGVYFSNISSNSFNVLDSNMGNIVTVPPGHVYQVVLIDTAPPSIGSFLPFPWMNQITDTNSNSASGILNLSSNLRVSQNPIQNCIDFYTNIFQLPAGTINLQSSYLEQRLIDDAGGTILNIPDDSATPFPDFTYFELMKVTHAFVTFTLTSDPTVTVYSIENPLGVSGINFVVSPRYQTIILRRLNVNSWLLEDYITTLQQAYTQGNGIINLSSGKPFVVGSIVPGGGSVSINDETENSIIDIQSTNQGSLSWPRMSTAERLALTTSPGLHVFDSDLQALAYYTSSNGWIVNTVVDIPVLPSQGGTGVVNNDSDTITLGGVINTASDFNTSGAFPLTLTTTAATNATIPSGTVTLVALPGSTSITTLGTITTGDWQADVIQPQFGGTGVANGSTDTITLGGPLSTSNNFTTTGANPLTLNTNGTTVATFPIGTITLVALPGSTAITTVGILTTGAWQANIIQPQWGGTGIANGSNTITLGGNINTANSFSTSGNFPLIFTTTNTTNATIPSGTVTLLAAPGSSSITTLGTVTSGTWQASVIQPQWGGTGIANGSGDTINLGGPINTANSFTTSGNNPLTLTTTGTTNATLPSGTVTLIALPGSSSITTVGILTTGAWQANTIQPQWGGTGINNGSNTITLSGNINTANSFTTSGNNPLTLTTTGTTNATLPSGTTTLIGTPGSTGITTLGTITTGTWNATIISPTYGGTGVNNGSNTITLSGTLHTLGSNPLTFTTTGTTNATLPSGTNTLAIRFPATNIPSAGIYSPAVNNYYNCDSTGTVVFDLPAPTPGDMIIITSTVNSSIPWTINTVIGGTIYTNLGAASNFVQSTTVGQSITLIGLNSSDYCVVSYTGTIIIS